MPLCMPHRHKDMNQKTETRRLSRPAEQRRSPLPDKPLLGVRGFSGRSDVAIRAFGSTRVLQIELKSRKAQPARIRLSL